MNNRNINPFSLSQSAHMSDQQIDQLWVNLSISEIEKIKAHNPIIIKGGKGSGKTHLLRHHSFPVQVIRYDKEGINLLEGIHSDKYIGIYMRCGGLNASRFAGKGYSDDTWTPLFEYAFELILAEELIDIVCQVAQKEMVTGEIMWHIQKLFHNPDGNSAVTLESLKHYIYSLRRELDLAVNNAALGASLIDNPNTEIKVSRGSLIFGLPKIFRNYLPEFQDTLFIYLIDEFENFTKIQQRYVNTLVRETSMPVSIKIGVRKYGIKTSDTLSAEEKLQVGSDYETLALDEKLRSDLGHYRKFSYLLLKNRLGKKDLRFNEIAKWAKSLFENVDTGWNSLQINELINQKRNKNNQDYHFNRFKQNLELIKVDEQKAEKIIELLRFPDYPILEKVNIMNFYKLYNGSKSLEALANELHNDCNDFIKRTNRKGGSATSQLWNYYQNDIIDQLLNEFNYTPFYAGIDNFIKMSEGMPRNLINILKNVYDWSLFNDQKFTLDEDSFSLESQQLGVLSASDWYFNDLRKAGKDLQLLQSAISRLAELFKVNHYSDRPTECSLITFGGNITEASEEAQRTIEIAEDRSMLIRINKGHKDKNLGYEQAKFQLNKMLCPRWGLPISSRGTIELSSEELNIIFDSKSDKSSFEKLLTAWKEKRQAFKRKTNQLEFF